MDDLTKKTFQEHINEVPSVDFTDSVLQKIEAVVEEKKQIKPLIGKSTWFLLVGLLAVLLVATFVNYKPQSLSDGLTNIYTYIKTLLANINSYWFYAALGLIVIWEFVLRRRLASI